MWRHQYPCGFFVPVIAYTKGKLTPSVLILCTSDQLASDAPNAGAHPYLRHSVCSHLLNRPDLALENADGFGEAGSEQHGVGPDADLEIDLTLLDWHHVSGVKNQRSMQYSILENMRV